MNTLTGLSQKMEIYSFDEPFLAWITHPCLQKPEAIGNRILSAVSRNTGFSGVLKEVEAQPGAVSHVKDELGQLIQIEA